MYEICNFVRRISSRSPIWDTSDICCVANESVQKAHFFADSSQRHENSCIANRRSGGESTHRIAYFISYTDQFVVPPIFKYLIGAKDVEIRLVRKFDSAEQAPSTKVSIDLEFINPIWLGCLGCLDRLGLDFSLREDLHCRWWNESVLSRIGCPRWTLLFRQCWKITGDTLVPLVLTSDETHSSNFAGDKK